MPCMKYTEDEIADFIKAGKIASKAKLFGAKMIKPGAKMIDVLMAVEEKIYESGGRCAFAPQSSINNCAAHFAPRQDNSPIYKEGDVVKIDIGVMVEGLAGVGFARVLFSHRHSPKKCDAGKLGRQAHQNT